MGVALPLAPRPVPLFRLDNGVYRVTNTRIPLERIVEMHREGASPEQIVEAFEVLKLSDVYTLIGYYLDNRAAVDEYVRRMDELGDEMERKIKAEMPLPPGFKQGGTKCPGSSVTRTSTVTSCMRS
jgi:uncharacterized protein (DUF433 family)